MLVCAARRLMGEKAGVPVEPDEQTAFADGTLAVPGVVAAGVPGGPLAMHCSMHTLVV